jgi:hypothetical protein
MAENALHRADPSEPVSRRENPAVKAGLFRVYGVVNLYLTFLEDIERMYLLGIQATST